MCLLVINITDSVEELQYKYYENSNQMVKGFIFISFMHLLRKLINILLFYVKMYTLTNIPDMDRNIFNILDVSSFGNYGITNKNNYEITQKCWQERLSASGIVFYHEYEYVNYKELYKIYDYIKYILDDQITDLESDYVTFHINRNILMEYYIKLMIFLGINIDEYYDRLSNKMITFDDKIMKNKVPYIDVHYKKSKNYYSILLFESYVASKCFCKLTYNQVLNFMFNASLDGVIEKITLEYD